MTRDNEKQMSENSFVAYFDSVSLYPSVIKRIYVLEGKPKTIPNCLDGNYIIDHLFDDGQIEPTKERLRYHIWLLLGEGMRA